MSLFEALALIYQSLQSNLGQLPANTFPCCLSTTTFVLCVKGSFFPLLYMIQFCPQHTREDLIYRKSLVVLKINICLWILIHFSFLKGQQWRITSKNWPILCTQISIGFEIDMFDVVSCGRMQVILKIWCNKIRMLPAVIVCMCIDETFNSEGSTPGGQRSQCCCLENDEKLLAYISS